MVGGVGRDVKRRRVSSEVAVVMVSARSFGESGGLDGTQASVHVAHTVPPAPHFIIINFP